MASVKKILEKHQAAKKTLLVEAQQPLPQQQAVDLQQPVAPIAPTAPRLPQFVSSAPSPMISQQKQLEAQAIETAQLAAANNPYSFESTCRYFPGSPDVMEMVKFPLGFFMNPYPDANAVQLELQSDRLLRCNNCRAYFNLYCKVAADGASYACSLCSTKNGLNAEQRGKLEGPERSAASYTVYPPESQFPGPPSEDCFVFMLDVSNSAAASQMLYYACSAMKEVLADGRFDDFIVLLYTYDESLHYYDLEGSEPTRIVVDRNIQEISAPKNPPYLCTVRTQLFEVLDSLEELAKTNPAARSRFFGSFATVFDSTKQYSPKIFALQANQMFVGEQPALEKSVAQTNDPNVPRKSSFETTNKTFFNNYVAKMLEHDVSMSFFSFSKNHKNLRVLSDLAKLTNSELQLYLKDSKEELMKFYYDFYALLGAPYLSEYKFELNLTPGWATLGVYGNMYRNKDTNSCCKVVHLDDRKRIACNMGMLTNYIIQPQLCIQLVSTYSEQRIRKTTITTVIVPITNSLYHIYDSVNYPSASGLLYRMYLSSLRMENSIIVRNKFTKSVGLLYTALKGFRKGAANFQSEELMFFQGALSFLKNQHCHPDTFCKALADSVNSMTMDRLICERNLLQCTSCDDLVTYFTPYLFRVSDMPPDCCTMGQNGLTYPENCDLSFQTIKSGVYVMDCTTHIFLFIARNYNPAELRDLFGVDKYSKETNLTEEILSGRLTVLSQKVMALISAIRERKHFQYIPLFVVKCGEGSTNELRFYLNFTNEKYEQFRSLNMNYKEFMTMLETQGGMY